MATVVAVLALVPAAAAASGSTLAELPSMRWLYQGETATTAATLTLKQAQVQSGHVAVWLGADNGRTWLQGGVIQTPGAKPSLYAEIGIELGTHPTQVKFVNLGSYQLGRRVRVALESNSLGRWWVVVDGRRFGSVYLGVASVQRTLAVAENCFLPGYENQYSFSLVPRL